MIFPIPKIRPPHLMTLKSRKHSSQADHTTRSNLDILVELTIRRWYVSRVEYTVFYSVCDVRCRMASLNGMCSVYVCFQNVFVSCGTSIHTAKTRTGIHEYTHAPQTK